MNDLNEKFCGLALKDVMARYIKNYFDLHGNVLPPDGLYDRIMNEVERPLIEETLRHMKGNQVRVAKLLGINRNTLRRRIQNLNISLGDL